MGKENNGTFRLESNLCKSGHKHLPYFITPAAYHIFIFIRCVFLLFSSSLCYVVLCCLVMEQSVKQMWSSHLSAFLGPFFMVGYVEHNENHNMWKCMYWFLLHDRSWAEWNCELTIFIAPESAITSDPCLNRCVIQDLTGFEPTIAWEISFWSLIGQKMHQGSQFEQKESILTQLLWGVFVRFTL